MLRSSRRAASIPISARFFTASPLADTAEQEWAKAVIPAAQSLAKEHTGKVYALNLYKLKAAAEYPDDYAGKRFATGAEAFDAFLTNTAFMDALRDHDAGAPAFVGNRTPGIAPMKREGMTFDGFEKMALMEWNSLGKMVEGFQALMAADSGSLVDAVVNRGAGLEQSAWLCFSPFEPTPDVEYDTSYEPAGPSLVDGVEAEFFTGLMPSLQAAGNEPIYCLNCYRFKDSPAYPGDFAGQRFDTGIEAHKHYVNAVLQMCRDTYGGELLFYGQLTPGIPALCREGLAFPNYDTIALMKYDSAASMLAMATSPEYNSVSVHRAAGVAEQTWTCYSHTRQFSEGLYD
eukprot:g6111.t1